MLKIALIQPPAEHFVCSYLPQVNASKEGIGFKPPLGLLYVATYLKHKLSENIEVKVIDCLAEGLRLSDCLASVDEWSPDVVGISAWTDFWYPAFTLGKKIKENLPSCKILYGGPHTAIYPEATLDVDHVDAVIMGDGEVPFYRFVQSLLNTESDCQSGQGLHYKQAGVNKNDLFYIEKDLDHLPIPDRTFLDIKKYSSVLFKGDYSATIITSRGCPHNCNFCKLHFQKPVCRSAENVVAEFRYLESLGIKEVEVYDDTFTWSKQRARAIAEQMIKEKIKINWAIRDRASSYDFELLKLLKEAGCKRVHYGIESGVQRVLETMRKRVTIEQIREAVIGAKELGFEVLTYFMFGNLGETAEDMEETIKFALKLPADYAEFSVTIPYPGTDLYQMAIDQGIISHDYWGEFAKNPKPDFVIPQVIENICDKHTLIAIQRKAMRKFYLRPAYIVRELKKLSSFSELKKKMKLAFGLFLK